jgi:hypothetical protein
MTTFESMYQNSIFGKITMMDRIIFKGHLLGFYPLNAFAAFLANQRILLKEFKQYMPKVTEKVKARALQIAQEANRPYIYLENATTKASGQSKEDLAKSIAERDNILQGLICVFGVVEPCMSFKVRSNKKTKKLEIIRCPRKCMHFYFYLIDPDFGFMHVRMQSWTPFQIQVYINGREWLCRQLDRHGISYERYENTLLNIDDIEYAQKLCQTFVRKRWPQNLNRIANRVNPYLPTISGLGFGSYYWCVDQCEVATDIMFKTRAALNALLPDFLEHALQQTSPEDVMRFLGRKLNGNFKGELTTDLKRRPEGYRIKHRMKRNSIKMYDKWSVLRIETTINNPREFKCLRVVKNSKGISRRWLPMNKGVANLWRYMNVATQSNIRYMDLLAEAQPKSKAVKLLDNLCRSHTIKGKPVAKFNPVSVQDCALFAAVLLGQNLINGFRNRDISAGLFKPPRLGKEKERQTARVSRLIAKMRGHGLIKKVPYCRIYRVTTRGLQIMTALLRFRHKEFAQQYNGSPEPITIRFAASG